MSCPHAVSSESWRTFKDGTRHIEVRCTRCNAFLGWKKQTQAAVDSLEQTERRSDAGSVAVSNETWADKRLAQAHRFATVPPTGFRRYDSKYRSQCIGCNRPIEPGDPIMWAKGCGVACLDCFRDLKGACK